MLTSPYKKYLKVILGRGIDKSRILTGEVETFANSTDASFYRLVPKIVIRVREIWEVRVVVEAARDLRLPVVFRSAGTSLSGGASTDSILVTNFSGFKKIHYLPEKTAVRLQAGVIGGHANQYLKKEGYKIGPDPASISSAMIGGIVSNNASGMCCGTQENSYQTIKEIKVVLPDGTYVDTEDRNILENDKVRELFSKLESLADSVRNDEELTDLIKKKYQIKNTIGYSLNALVDFTSGIDIFKHIMVGSEGTLGFIAEVVLGLVRLPIKRAVGLYIFPNAQDAMIAVKKISQFDSVKAVEYMDGFAISCVKDKAYAPKVFENVSKSHSGLLIEINADDEGVLAKEKKAVSSQLNDALLEMSVVFSSNETLVKNLWSFRKGMFPTVGSIRSQSSTLIIEDVCFPLEHLAKATIALRVLLDKYGYDPSIIFGHALAGNLHFVFSQYFETKSDLKRYADFIDDLASMVLSFDGSLKAEHGTGRNMSPYVEMEWKAQAYQVMWEIKKLFDPLGIFNPDVILSLSKDVHLKNIKSMVAVDDLIDQCTECGFCEQACPSKNLSLTPRQRIAVAREMARLKVEIDGKSGTEKNNRQAQTDFFENHSKTQITSNLGELPSTQIKPSASQIKNMRRQLKKMSHSFDYMGNKTCAVDGVCAVSCPIDINTGAYIKRKRRERKSLAKFLSTYLFSHYGGFIRLMNMGVRLAHFFSPLLFPIIRCIRFLTKGAKKEGKPGLLRAVYFKLGVLASIPNAAKRKGLKNITFGTDKSSIVLSEGFVRSVEKGNAKRNVGYIYLPSCLGKIFKPAIYQNSKKNILIESKSLETSFLNIVEKAQLTGVYVVSEMGACCGLSSTSKGIDLRVDQKFDKKVADKISALLESHEKIICVSDVSSCSKEWMGSPQLDLLDKKSVEFLSIDSFLMSVILPSVTIYPLDAKGLLFVPCADRIMQGEEELLMLAKKCVTTVDVVKNIECCGFAGDRGFLVPELNYSALSNLREYSREYDFGISNNLTCEVGLNRNADIPFLSLISVFDACSVSKVSHAHASQPSMTSQR